MLEFFSFLLALGSALKTTFDTIEKSEKKKIARKLHQIHIEIQSIIDNAERIFTLINDAEKNIIEFGEDKYSRILAENFHDQFNKLILLAKAIRNVDVSIVFSKLDNKLQKRIESIMYFKGDSIRNALLWLTDSKFFLKDKKLYIKYSYGDTSLAFPELNDEIQRIRELKECSRELGQSIYSAISLDDLL